MKDEKEKIDLLLEQNASQQLEQVDWQALNASISARLDQINRPRTVAIRLPAALKVAGGLAAVAALIFVAVFLATDRPADLQLQKGQRAAVKFIDRKGSASVRLEHASAKSNVLVDFGKSRGKVARCDVKIIDVGDEREKNGNRAAWIIISRPKPVFADNGTAKDMRDLICMF